MDLVRRHIKTDNLMTHILAVEAVMRYFARQFGEDEELWGCIGLAHDIDYEEHPEEHLQHTRPILEEAGWPEEYIRAVLSHGWGIVTDVKPETKLEKTLYTIDELTGLVAATALVRPSKSVLDMKAKSVKKKWKSRAFSAGVDREVIQQGADMLGMELSEVITWTIMGMREAADQIGLKGRISSADDE
jgi:putative nucleotidyltransferase with HDIG domain